MKYLRVGKIMNIRKSIVALFLRGLRPCGAALALTFMLVGLPVSTQAEDRLAQIFQDNMVLQREKPVPVWGWANPGAQVEVSFGGQKKQAKANEKGYWKAILDPMTANRAGQLLTAQIGTTTISRKNVLVGEVWFEAGHSNNVAGGPDLDTGVYPHYVSPGIKAGKPEIRICDFGFGASLEPLDDIDPAGRGDAPWQVLKEYPPSATMGPSHYFARVVRDALDIPVGIILVALPGTAQLAWMSRETLEGFPAQQAKQADFYQERLAFCENNLSKLTGPITSWATFKQAETTWRETKTGLWPTGKADYVLAHVVSDFPTSLYNTRIHPLAPFALRGAIFHCSLGDSSPGAAERLVAMVKQWRGLFGQDVCFIYSPNPRRTTQQPPLTPFLSSFYVTGDNLATRQSLKLFGEDKNVALVELYDIGDPYAHFLQKAEMGRRNGLAALTVAYGQNHIYTGPRMVETKIVAGKAIVRFEQVGDGLVYQPSIDGISGVYLRGKNGPSRWGQVKILSKDTVEFSHPDIADLNTVAYAGNPNPHETLFNSVGLPASPFTVNPPANSDPQPSIQLLSMLGADGKDCIMKEGVIMNQDALLNLCHVRRSGYVFQILPYNPKASPAPVTFRAYIPAEWKGFEVEVVKRLEYLDTQLTPSERKGLDVDASMRHEYQNGKLAPEERKGLDVQGKRLEATETNKEGKRFASFKAPVDGSWVIVSEAGKAAEFRKVNRY